MVKFDVLIPLSFIFNITILRLHYCFINKNCVFIFIQVAADIVSTYIMMSYFDNYESFCDVFLSGYCANCDILHLQFLLLFIFLL